MVRSDSGFRRLFDGFQAAQLITYVGEPAVILDLFERSGYKSVDLIISENFNDVKGRLTIESVGKLKARMEEGSLRVYIPKPHNRIHTKLYLLEKNDCVRVLFTSRNLSSSRSLDIVLWFDAPPNHPFVVATRAMFKEHLEATVVFLGDLLDRIRSDPDAETQLIEAYLADPDATTDAIPVVLADATLRAMADPDVEVLTIQIPDRPKLRQRLEAEIAKAGYTVAESEGVYRVDNQRFRAVVSRVVQLPIMVVDRGRRRVTVMIDGTVADRASPPPSNVAEVWEALDHVERYIATIDLEQASTHEKTVHKTAMMEVLLYLFASPFSHELMQLMQHHYGLVQKRGPRFLLVHGQTHRGKTTFLAFVLSLVAGKRVDPLSAKTYFKEGFIRQALAYKTTFPLIFDDMLTVSSTQFEGIVKDYWEKNWNSRDPVPQLVFSTNRGSLRQSVVTRVKKVYFPVFIEPTPEKKKVLNQLREQEVSNHLFEWFAYTYLDLLSTHEQPPPDDDLYLARLALKRLYVFAGRTLPTYFPEDRFERLYDTSRTEWSDMLRELHKADLAESGDRILVQFHKDMSRDDVLPYAAILPLSIDHEVKGNTIIIHSAAQFRAWLPGEVSKTAPPSGVTGQHPPAPGVTQRLRKFFQRG
jgi:hypothetical protein